MEIKNLKKRSEVKSQTKFLGLSESEAESELYYQLLRAGIRGMEKQYPIGPFFADIAIPEYRLVVEYDGKQHKQSKDYDFSREKYIMDQGWKIIRTGLEGLTINKKRIVTSGLIFSMNSAIDYAVKFVKKLIQKKNLSNDIFTLAYVRGVVSEERIQQTFTVNKLQELKKKLNIKYL